MPKTSEAIKNVLQQIREKTGDPNADFPSFFSLGKSVDSNYIWHCIYRQPTKNGFTKKTYEMAIQIEYCPFTGKKLQSIVEKQSKNEEKSKMG